MILPPSSGRPHAEAPVVGTVRRAVQLRVGGLPHAFWWLWLGTLVNRAGGFVVPFLVLYLTGPRGLSVQQSGIVVSTYGVGALFSQIVGGFLADRIGRRTTMVMGLAGTGIALGGLGAARGLGMILVSALLVGLVADLYRPASTALIGDLIAAPSRRRAFALQYWAVNLGFSVATIVGGILASHGYTMLFVGDAFTCLIFSALVRWLVPETGRSHAEAESTSRFAGLHAISHDRLLLATIALVLLYAVLNIQVSTVLPLHVRDVGLPTAAYGLALAVNGVTIVVLQPLLLPLFDRIPRSWLLPSSLTLFGAGIAASGLATSVPSLAVTVVVWTLGEIGFSGSVQALLMTIAPVHLRGRYVGAMGLSWGSATLLGPLIGTQMYAAHPDLVWWGSLFLGLVAAIGYWFLTKAAERRSATNAQHV